MRSSAQHGERRAAYQRAFRAGIATLLVGSLLPLIATLSSSDTFGVAAMVPFLAATVAAGFTASLLAPRRRGLVGMSMALPATLVLMLWDMVIARPIEIPYEIAALFVLGESLILTTIGAGLAYVVRQVRRPGPLVP